MAKTAMQPSTKYFIFNDFLGDEMSG
jgi:hypothetical protein